jgi:hypothetical protein
MPDNKKHHFVSKFYLRNFSKDGHSIGIFNIRSQRTIPQGNLSNQCYRDYFYGKSPELEHALGGMEASAAQVIKHLLATEAVPRPLSPEHVILSHFVVFQAARTGYEAEAMAEATDKFFKTVYREQFGNLDGYEIGFDDPVLMSLRASSRMVPAIYDLKIKLLRNETGVGFITSDNPVVRHNQYFEGNEHAGHAGLGQAGLQLFLPLSPKYLCLFYDAQTYKVGDKNSRVVAIVSTEDVAALNALQWLNAHENIYFADGQEKFVEEQAPRIIGRRRNEKSSVSEHEIVGQKPDPVTGNTETLLHEFRPGLKLRLRVGCIKMRRHPKHPRHNVRPAPLRNREYSEVVEQFGMLLAANKAVPEDFFAYAARHPSAARS